MQISKRLQALGDMVSQGHVLADVGCDHGYIPIYLMEQKRIPRAIAMDIVVGPLSKAREHIRAHGLEGYIETRLSDGLEKLEAGEADTILISGMGGPLMERILFRGQEVLEGVSELILQPQSDIGHFREFLQKLGYKIIQEEMVWEDGKFYPMMRAVFGKESYTPLEYRYGPLLLKNRHPVLKQYLEKEEKTLAKILVNLENQGGEGARQRYQEVLEEQKLSREALTYYDLQRDT